MKCRKAAKKMARASERGQQQQQQGPSGAAASSYVAPEVNMAHRSAAGSSRSSRSNVTARLGNRGNIGAADGTSEAGQSTQEAVAAVQGPTASSSGSGAGVAAGSGADLTVSSSRSGAEASPFSGEVPFPHGNGSLAATQQQDKQPWQQQQVSRPALPALLLEEHATSSSSRIGDAGEEAPITPSRVSRHLQPRPVTCDMIQVRFHRGPLKGTL
jgi:hypothetical protein